MSASDGRTAGPTGPSPEVRRLDRLVGTWEISGGARGRATYEWMEGGYFLLQRIEMDHDGNRVAGTEVIGRLQEFGAEPSTDIHSRFYGSGGETFDYVYDLTGDTLMIWGGERGSPAYYEGRFSADGSTLSGGWVYPGGGGYQTVSTRVRP